MPVGENGITRISQTQFYHLYGPLGATVAFAIPLAGTLIQLFRVNFGNFLRFLKSVLRLV